MRTRSAIVGDARHVAALVANYSGDGTLLPRTYAEVCENIRDFVVVEEEGKIIGCGALHIYGPHLAEVRSIAVTPRAQRRGAGRRVVRWLLKEARRQRITRVCLFTRIPEYFARLGFSLAQREQIPDKLYRDCLACPRLECCDEIAMVREEVLAEDAVAESARVAAGQARSQAAPLVQIAK